MAATRSRPLSWLGVVLALALLATLTTLSGSAGAASSTLVINEVDYDQPGTDAAEFLELENVSGSAIDLDPYSVELVNGNAGGAVLYQTIGLPAAILASGDVYVICANATTVANCDLDVTPETNLIQNGSPDGIGLRLGATLIDALSYEGNTGAPYTETSGAGLDDDASLAGKALSRCPDGFDTDRNNADFGLRDATPGIANSCPPVTPAEINDIQGAAHLSPLAGTSVLTTGIVTATRSNGFWMQDPSPDSDPRPPRAS
ncbi:hypothetical protein BH20ACT13_BH20ACT13_02120 [soil metagenome]